MEKLVGSGKSTTMTSNISFVCCSHWKASVLTIFSLGEASDPPLRPTSVSCVEKSRVMFGSSSTSVMLSTPG